jgi:biuret amidohydrolase
MTPQPHETTGISKSPDLRQHRQTAPGGERFPRHALLITDLQEGLCRTGDQCLAPPLAEEVSRRDVLRVAAAVQATAIQNDVPVLQTRLAFDPAYINWTNHTPRFRRYPTEGLLTQSDPGAQIVTEMQSSATVLVTKGCVDPLVGTALPAILMANGTTDLFIGGVATNLAVESATRHAADLGLRVWVVEDMCASSSELHELAVEKTLPLFAEIVSSNQAMEMLAEPTRCA